MRLKVTPSSVGDTLKYSRGTLWTGAADMKIDKYRPGGDVHEFKRRDRRADNWEQLRDRCVSASYVEFNEPLPHPLDEKGTGVEVYIKVAQKTGWQATLAAFTAALGLGSTPGPDDLEFKYSPPVYMDSVPLEGAGTTNGSGRVHSEDCPAPLPATTRGDASARWLEAPPEAKVEPPAWAEHISPDGGGPGSSKDDCSQGVSE